MNCSPVDLRDYFFGELPEEHRRQAELHVKTCVSCREELDRLGSTQSALLSVADEEIPQRIGFVSDRVYEPSAARRWWGAFWGSAPRLGFASAAMLSAALFVSATHRTPPAPPAAVVDTAGIQAELSRQVKEAVVQAVAESDARHEQRTAQLLAATTARLEAQRRADIEKVSQSFAFLQKYAMRDYRAAAFPDGSR